MNQQELMEILHLNDGIQQKIFKKVLKYQQMMYLIQKQHCMLNGAVIEHLFIIQNEQHVKRKKLLFHLMREQMDEKL
jgi:hypothetical protein